MAGRMGQVPPTRDLHPAEDWVERLRSVVAGDERVVFVVGAGLSWDGRGGVWGVSQIVEHVDAICPGVVGVASADRYQNALGTLKAKRGVAAVEQAIRRAVLAAANDGEAKQRAVAEVESGRGTSECRALQDDSRAWYLPRGVSALAELIRLMVGNGTAGRSRPCVLSTNFDGLVEVALRLQGIDFETTVVTGNRFPRGLGQKVSVVHLHGSWLLEPTLHSPWALQVDRPRLATALQSLLDGARVFVLGYGGWNDIVLDTVSGILEDEAANRLPEVMWAFHREEGKVRDDELNPKSPDGHVLAAFSSAAAAASTSFYCGVDVHRDLPKVVEGLRGRVGVPASKRPVTSSLAPSYQNKHAQDLSERLQGLLRRRDALRAQGEATANLDAEIVQARRLLRAGAPEPGWELGDGRYLLLHKLGHGGFATVWKARDLRVPDAASEGGLVAIKVMHAHMAGDPVNVERFFRGARIMADLGLLGIVRVIEPRCEDQGHLYFVMELMEGGTFRTAIRERRINQAQALEMILAVGKTLAAAHGRGYVHRDVKPANILLGRDGEAKLCDFDLVAAADTTGGTRTGVLGTWAYCSPECMERPQDAGPAADVFSLGMTLVFALTGEDPRPLTMDREYRSLRCASSLKRVLRRATSIQPADRHSTAAELVMDLQQTLGSGETVTGMSTWARRADKDEYGTFAELELAPGVVTRLRWIPPGEFVMGSPQTETGRFEDEGPEHRVKLTHGFWLADSPCTQAEWKAVMGTDPSHFKGADFPAEQVSWDDCQEFCQKLRVRFPGLEARLPTEAEWEYACRAGTTSAFNDGSPCTKPEGEDPALLKLGWFDQNSGGGTHAVRGMAPNEWGLFDMHGNVWEWCQDGYGKYSAHDQVDPAGAARGLWRVYRGGSWANRARFCRSACLSWSGSDWCDHFLGFRLASGQSG
jgi:formylglycine-generating enzyme required for sulfatase activity